jgi:hypothetical protein
MVDNFLKVADERGRTHLEILIDFGANSEESDSNRAVELYEMGENGLDNLFSSGM